MTERSTSDATATGDSAARPLSLLRDRLIARRRELGERVHAVEKDLQRDDNPAAAAWSERSAQRENDEVLTAIGAADTRELAAIDAALHRLQIGTYGSCTRCGKRISAKRLQALPHTEHCERCALKGDAQHRTAR